MSFDQSLFGIIHSFAGISGILDVLFVFLAKYLAFVIVFVALIFLLKREKGKDRIYAFIFIFFSLLLSWGFFLKTIQYFYVKQRPFQVFNFIPFFNETSHSFPSGHATFLFAIAFSVWYFDKKTGWWLIGLSILNGLGRIIAGVHWPSDIVGGIIVSLFSVYIVALCIGRYNTSVGKRKDDIVEIA